MGLDFPGETYQQQFLLADIALTGQPCADNEAVICTSPRGVVVVGRMPNGSYRIVATLPPGARVPQRPDRIQAASPAGESFSPYPRVCGLVDWIAL
jgi:hypothetical protein